MSHNDEDDLRTRSIGDAAAQWYTDFQTDAEQAEADHGEWGKWSSSDENLSAYDRLADLHQRMITLPPPALAADDELVASPFANGAGAVPLLDSKRRRGFRRWPFGWAQISLAACLLAAVILAAPRVPAIAYRLSGVDSRFITSAGEQREVMLPDGSAITIGGDTSIQVRYGLWQRRLTLDRGEGMFKVAHQLARPFTVCTNVACTTAVGTIFDVRVYAARVSVWVQQGVVSISPPETTQRGETALRLLGGQELSYDLRGIKRVSPVDNPRLQGAWIAGELVYHSRPLAEVLEDVQRYSTRPIYLDPAAGDLQFTGSVLQSYINDWLRGLASVYAVRVVDCQNLPIENGSPVSEDDRALCSKASNRILIRPR